MDRKTLRAASTTKTPFITKPRIRVTGRFLAVAVGEGRVEEGNRCTALLFEILTSVCDRVLIFVDQFEELYTGCE
jgi:hypothetical protein